MQAGVPEEIRQAEKQQALAADPLPAAEQAALWDLLGQPGGISGREAARQLQRAQPIGQHVTWSHTTVINQLRLWESGGKVERTGRGKADTRWHALPAGTAPKTAPATPPPYLHAVPDDARPGQRAAAPSAPAALPMPGRDRDDEDQADEGEVLDAGRVPGAGQLTTQQAAVMVAFWALQNGAEHAIAAARASGMPDAVIVYALHLAEQETSYVKAEVRQILTDSEAPVPAWLSQDAGRPPAGDQSAAR
jgi:hypothetical protein